MLSSLLTINRKHVLVVEMWTRKGRKALLGSWVRLKTEICRETPLWFLWPGTWPLSTRRECVSAALCFAWCFIFQLINVLIDWLSNQLAGPDKMYWSPSLPLQQWLTIFLVSRARHAQHVKIVCKYFRNIAPPHSSLDTWWLPVQCPPNVHPCQVCRLSCSLVDTFISFYPTFSLVVCPALITILEALTISN